MTLCIKSAAIVTGNRTHAAQDKKALQQLEIQPRGLFARGAQAREALDESPPHILLVDSELEDMDGVAFIRDLRRRRGGHALPVVMVTLENRRELVLDAISAGCSGYVLRPYAPATLERHLLLASESARPDVIESEQLDNARGLVSMGQFDEAIEEFQEILEERNEAQKYFDAGTRYLLQQKYGKAIIAFNKAIKLNELYAEAYKGLADAHRGKGNEAEYQQFLKRAADIYALQDRLQEAKELFVEILKSDPDAVNPYNALGVELRRKGDFAGAIHAYRQALEISPHDENLFYNISKAYLHAGDPGQAQEFISRALERNPGFMEARKLFAQLAEKEWHVAAPKLAVDGPGASTLVVDS